METISISVTREKWVFLKKKVNMLSEDCAHGRFIDRVYGQYYTYTVFAVFLKQSVLCAMALWNTFMLGNNIQRSLHSSPLEALWDLMMFLSPALLRRIKLAWKVEEDILLTLYISSCLYCRSLCWHVTMKQFASWGHSKATRTEEAWRISGLMDTQVCE